MRSKSLSVFLKPKALYNAKQAMSKVPKNFEVPFGKCRIRREGTNLTILTYGNTVHHCLEAAEKIAADLSKSVEVIDLRSIKPLDKEGILKSVNKTNKYLVVHEDKVFAGFGRELITLINEKAFESLNTPVRRIDSENTPVGFNRILEKAVLPNADKVYEDMKNLIKY